MSKAIVILSGGMDSQTLLYSIKDKEQSICAISFNYNQKQVQEIECARWNCNHLGIEHKIVDISNIGKSLLQGNALTSSNVNLPEGHYNEENMSLTVVPARNLIMLSISIAHAISIKYDNVYIGVHGGDHHIYYDCRPSFIFAMNQVAAVCDKKAIQIKTPFLNMTKGQIAALGKELNVPYEHSWTCYRGGEKACGRCGSDIERILAFHEIGMRDPVEYDEGWDEVLKHALLIDATKKENDERIKTNK